ncbi:MAG: prepilin-type N-terminal cleavage/methylation domain-containing protein [Candidatus Pacebacteria bacterium]|nr:prepilin-type N-terminal cleavage/methylation domain-containing protein [Candidatus Paceibacterota bacterium]
MSSLIRIIKIKNIKYKGFSMVEAVIAIAVLTVILTPTFDFIITLISISKNLQNRAEMVNISYEGLEFMINLRENIKKECNSNYYSGISGAISINNTSLQFVCKDNAASSDQISSGLGFQIFSNMILPIKDNNLGCNASTTATIQPYTNLCQIDINKFNSTSTIWNIINNDYNDSINNTNTPAPISATNASNTTAYYNTNDSSNNFSNLLKLYKQSSGSVDYNSTASGASSTQYARLI